MFFSVDTDSPEIFSAMSFYNEEIEEEIKSHPSSWITDKNLLSPLVQASFITFGKDAYSNPCFCEITKFRIYVDIFINEISMLSIFTRDLTGKLF